MGTRRDRQAHRRAAAGKASPPFPQRDTAASPLVLKATRPRARAQPEDLAPLQKAQGPAMQRHRQGTETRNWDFHGIVISQPSSTNVRKRAFFKGNGSLKSVRNESPCRDPSKQASPVTVSWEHSLSLTWKHLNLLPSLPLCSPYNMKMNLLRRTQNSIKAQISYN